MIVRISTESQYASPTIRPTASTTSTTRSSRRSRPATRTASTSAFEELLALVRAEGSVLGADELEGSDVILPPPDTSFVEASTEFTGDGLIPD